jgi:hypothetical protein
MNIQSLITTFAIVSASSVASAKPVVSFDASATASWNYGPSAQPQPPVIVRDHRELDDDDDYVTTRTPGVDARIDGRFDGRFDNRWRHRHEPAPIFINNTKYVAWNAADYVGPLGFIDGRRSYGLTALTAPTKVEYKREDFYIMGKGRFDTLQLRNTVGSTFVKQVTIEFMDDSAQVVPLNATLDRYNSAITIDVKGRNRPIKRIFVYGQTANNSAYQIFAG